MTERVLGPTGSPRRRWTLLLPLAAVMAVGLMWIAGAGAQVDRTLFELDGDATTDTTYTKAGVLNAAVATASDGATTSITICQAAATFADGTLILVDAERMSLAGGATVSGGGCPSDFPNKRSYTATRGVGDSTPGDHAKSEDVSQINTIVGSHDWDEVYDLVGNPPDPDETCSSIGAVECAWTHDDRATSIFTSSKDYDEISGTPAHWQWRDQSVPDADELDDGFAVKYINADDEQQLYFGADRFATNGTKDAGFWFFHQTIATVDPVGGADGTFTGTHTAPVDTGNDGFCNEAEGGNVPGAGTSQPSPVPACDYDDNDTAGDVLVLTTFTGGGAVTTVRVFEWVGPAGSTAALLSRGTGADCVPGNTSQELCATVNDTTIESPWDYDGKNEPADDEIASGGFLEGGLNLSDLGLEGCFSSFMATTRSAASLTADPKDFILGNFEACGIGMTTTPTDEDDIATDEITLGDSVYDHAIVQGTGGGPDPTGTVTFFICAPDELDAPDDNNPATPDDNPNTCDVGGTQVGTAVTLDGGSDANDATATADSILFEPDAAGTWCWRGEYSGDDIYDAASDSSTGECFDVTDTSSILTDQSWVPNDSATLTATGGGHLEGTLTITLYDNLDCTPGDENANVLYQEPFDIDTDDDTVTETTSNGDGSGTGLETDVIFTEDDSPVGALSWKAVFDSVTDSADSEGPCESTSQFTIDDNDPS